MNKGKDEILNKIEQGILKAHRKLIEERAANNDTVVVSVNGVPQHVPAGEILDKDTLQKKQVEN